MVMKAAIDEREFSGLGRNVVQSMKDRKSPTNVVELVPRGAIERMAPAGEKTGARGYRLARLAREQQTSVGSRQPAEGSRPAASSVRCGETAPEERIEVTAAAIESPFEAETVEAAKVEGQLHYKAEECFDLARMPGGVTVVVWKLDRIDDWMAPVLGVCCKELLGQRQVRKAVFDLSRVENISTAAIATLVRFRNTACHLDMTVHVVAGPRLRAELERAVVDRVMDVRDNIYALIQPAAAKPGLLGRLFGK